MKKDKLMFKRIDFMLHLICTGIILTVVATIGTFSLF